MDKDQIAVSTGGASDTLHDDVSEKHSIEKQTDLHDIQKTNSKHGSMIPSEGAKKRLSTFTIYLGLCVAMFMASLNSTVIAPAMGKISADLDDLPDATWIATGYFVAFNATQPLYGKFSDIFGRKPVIQVGIVLFCIGSIVNACAKTMGVLIAGRTIQGLGGGGIISIVYIIIADIAPLHMRPRYQSLMMVIYGVASVFGPLIGGAFVDHVTWRWDFWLNVILSVIAFALITIFLQVPLETPSSLASKIKRIDWLGIALSILFVVLLLLALSWGGVKYAWGSPHIIGTFIGSGVSLLLLGFVEGKVAKEPLIPLPVLFNPSVAIIYTFTFMVAFGFIGAIYFGPVMFQAVYLADSTGSGVRLLPYMVCMIGASIGGGYLIPIVKRVKPFLILGACFNLLGYGLFYSLNPQSSYSAQAGFLGFAGLGFGFTMQNTVVAVQNATEKKFMAVATSLNTFFMTLASTVGIAIYQTVMNVLLEKQLPTVDPAALQAAEAVNAIEDYTTIVNIPPQYRTAIIDLYNVCLHNVFLISIVTAAVALIVSLFINNAPFGAPPAVKQVETGAQQTEPQPEVVTDEEKGNELYEAEH
ncbi:hypothetical protein NQZ79_g4129 [Umbelopsis isabellina]|nr:hypothetical protein NQZ79_g4129 [Umbelopsis isabellina]